jgi:hypothetical protein
MVRPTHYSFRAHYGNYFLRSWVFEGSVDGSSWVVLDQQKDDTTTNSEHPIGTFAVSHCADCRFVRLRATGKNSAGTDSLFLQAFEIFGHLTRDSRSNQESA